MNWDVFQDAVLMGMIANILLLAKNLIDFFKTATDNRLQLREKDEENRELRHENERLKETIVKKDKKLDLKTRQLEKVSKDYFALKGGSV